MTKLPWGTRVRFRRKLTRCCWRRGRRTWERTLPSPKFSRGIVIGYRTLFEGTVVYEDWGGVFTPCGHVTAALVAFEGDYKRNPVYVALEDLEEVKDEQGS